MKRALRNLPSLSLIFLLQACSSAPLERIDTPVSPPAGSSVVGETARAPHEEERKVVWATGPWVDLEVSPGAPALERGAQAVVAKEWAPARKELERALSSMGATAPIDEQLAGRALLGRVCAELHDAKCAEGAYAQVIADWRGPDVIVAAGGDEATTNRRLQRALLAVGEAHFFRAEQKRQAANKLQMPAYKGDSDAQSIQAFINRDVGGWAKDKLALIDEAEQSYLAISALEPAPPPRWAVRGTARAAQLWGYFSAQFRAAPIPLEWKGTGPVPGSAGTTWADVRRSYYGRLDVASQPQLTRAVAAYERCQTASSRLRYADDYSRSCDAWLARR